MSYKLLKNACVASCCIGGLLGAGTASATDWLMLQGTEPAGAGAPARIFGGLQPTYQEETSSDSAAAIASNTAPEPTLIAPNFQKQEQFQLMRAMLGVRGLAFPIDDSVNYLLNVEFGTNAATDGGPYGQRTPVRLMDASVTVNSIPGARIRTGLFKTPGPEELLQGIIGMDYINFTDVSSQMMLERFPRGVQTSTSATDNHGNGDGKVTPTEAQWTSSFGAARDLGMEVFDSFHANGWTHSYAVMIGNGNGLQVQDSIADGPEEYLYWASEKVFSGKGPLQQGVKFFIWQQTGKRRVDLSDDNTYNPVTHDRIRQGIGMRYRRGNWRLGTEYMQGKGMIFQGPNKPNFGFGTPAALQDLDGKANGWYVDAGYYVPNTRWELDARYDQYNRSTSHQYDTARFTTTTLGVVYHINARTRVTFDYAMRNDKALDAIPTSGPLVTPLTNLHNGLASIKDRLALQLTMMY